MRVANRSRGPLLVAWLLAVGSASLGSGAATPALRFARAGETLGSWTLRELRVSCAETTVVIPRDPYYGDARRFRACPLRDVLQRGFGSLEELEGRTLLLRARDGYTRVAQGSQLLEPGGYLAFADADRLDRGEEGFDPIDRRQVDPAPFYLVWTGAGRTDTHRWPWPYQLAAIELASFEEAYPHTVPVGAGPGSAVRRGYALFQRECAQCHAINGEGGKVGPDLNVPRSIVDYRPEAQIRAFIVDPRSFRYTSMPSHRHLGEEDLDALLAYLRHMSRHPYDPGPGTAH